MRIKILIMGAGIRGKRLYSIFKEMGINIEAFLDNDKNKQNMFIEGVRCCAVEEYRNEANDVIVFVSPENSKELEKELSRIFPVVIGNNFINLIFSGASSRAVGYKNFFPIGHFYSLYPLLEKAQKEQRRLLKHSENCVCGGSIDFRIEDQLAILDKMSCFYDQVPNWKEIEDKSPSDYRFRYYNPSFPPVDAIGLYAMLRVLQPKKVIEVGSGWTSAIMLDTNENFFNGRIGLSFIEPYPDLLRAILKDGDKIDLMDKGLEDIDLDYFDKLQSGDILFIDSTHISKTGSDVNYLFFEILPRLKNGVYIHLHDIFYPFEYPIEWIRKGMVFNELYLLRAFLQYNDKYEIVFFQNMIEQEYQEKFCGRFPIKDAFGGGSFWMRKK